MHNATAIFVLVSSISSSAIKRMEDGNSINEILKMEVIGGRPIGTLCTKRKGNIKKDVIICIESREKDAIGHRVWRKKIQDYNLP